MFSFVLLLCAEIVKFTASTGIVAALDRSHRPVLVGRKQILSEGIIISLEWVSLSTYFYFETIEFVVVNGATTTTYQYKFLNFNSDVELVFPAELVSY